MTVFDSLLAQAQGSAQRIVLSEGEDPRIIEGAIRAQAEQIAQPVLVGDAATVESRLVQAGSSADKLQIVDPASSEHTQRYAAAYHELRAHKGMDEQKALMEMRSNPLVFAAMMVRQGDAKATIGGAVHTTGDTVRAALQIIGKAEGVRTVSSFFLMLLEQAHHGTPRALMFADCALNIQPSAAELAQIALSSAHSFEALLGQSARVAMLSFSTQGSARHDLVTHVQQATANVRELNPQLLIDGDIQFDAAFVPEVAQKKIPSSRIAGNANVFIFPDIEAGNIGYKIAQRIGGAEAIGPVLQGLAQPANDLSRGCDANDVYKLMAVTAIQATMSAAAATEQNSS